MSLEQMLYQLENERWIVEQIASRSLTLNPCHPDEIATNTSTMLARLLLLQIALAAREPHER